MRLIHCRISLRSSKPAHLALAINHFLIGQYRAEFRAPIHRGFADEGEALLNAIGAAGGSTSVVGVTRAPLCCTDDGAHGVTRPTCSSGN